jgi:hypothetical protein
VITWLHKNEGFRDDVIKKTERQITAEYDGRNVCNNAAACNFFVWFCTVIPNLDNDKISKSLSCFVENSGNELLSDVRF